MPLTQSNPNDIELVEDFGAYVQVCTEVDLDMDEPPGKFTIPPENDEAIFGGTYEQLINEFPHPFIMIEDDNLLVYTEGKILYTLHDSWNVVDFYFIPWFKKETELSLDQIITLMLL